MRIWHKLLIAPILAILFLLGFGAIAFGVVGQQTQALDDLEKTRLEGVSTVMDAKTALAELHSDVYRTFTWIGRADEAGVRKARADQRAKLESVGAVLARLGGQPHLTTAERRLLDAAPPLLASYGKAAQAALDLSGTDVAGGAALMQAADVHYAQVARNLDEVAALHKRLAQQEYEKASAAAASAPILLGSILVLATAAALAAALLMSRAIVRPLQVAIVSAQRIAAGNLAQDVQVRGKDETGDLLRALAEMTHSLRELLGEVAGGAHMVADTSAQIAQGNQDLSQRTEEQASTLEQTASSMQELTSTVSLNAQNARQASQVALGASELARQGGQAVAQVVSTMAGISESSRRIGDIIGVIDGIAFQTNILALNAAVEAARAGEQGRGFAVVAAEVRSLAQRSATAAKEIKTLIGASVEKVDAGGKLVDTAGHTMEQIVASVKKVSELIAEIAAASEEQDAGIQQVNTAVAQMDRVVQQNASLVEEAAAATESMKSQAGALLQVVSRFRLAEVRPADPPAPLHSVHPASTVTELRPAQAFAVKPSARLAAVGRDSLAAPLARTVGGGDWKEF